MNIGENISGLLRTQRRRLSNWKVNGKHNKRPTGVQYEKESNYLHPALGQVLGYKDHYVTIIHLLEEAVTAQ